MQTQRQTFAQACFQFACEWSGVVLEAEIGGELIEVAEVTRVLHRRQQPAVMDYELILRRDGYTPELWLFGDEGQVRKHIPARRR